MNMYYLSGSQRYRTFLLSLFMFCIVTTLVVAQPNPDSQLKYIDIIPPSPAVAKIADYSQPDVGLNSGTAQFHLPITSLSVGTITIPVGLNYSSNGVKVDALSSRTGVDFQFELGGAITRTMKGNGADENMTMLNPPLNYGNNSRTFITYLQRLTKGPTGGYDSEPDMFTFSFCGTGGKFFMDTALNIYQVPKTNNKIEHNFNGTVWNFRITDDKGNAYYFGGTGYIETSKRNQTCSHPSTTATITTAWFLRQIVLYNGDVVNFNYKHMTYTYDMGASETMYYQPIDQSQYGTAAGCDQDCSCNCRCPVLTPTQCVSYIDVDTYFLKSVATSRKDSVVLGYKARSDYGDSLLNSVTKFFNGKLMESYKFNYTKYTASGSLPNLSLLPGTNISDRYFLSSVTQLFNGSYINRYTLSYNDPGSLPMRLSFAQDHWGYYNGMSANNTLIPVPPTLDLINQFPNATANRDVDTVLCKKGLLTRVQYQTGGYDSISYQANTVYMTKTIYPTTPAYVYGTVNGGTGHAAVTQTVGTFSVQFAQTVSITFNSKNIGNSGADFHYGSTYSLSGPTPDIQGLPTGTDSTPGDSTYIGDMGTTAILGKQIVLQPGYYTLTLTATGSLTQAFVSVTYVPGGATDVTKNWFTAGARVGQIVTKSFDGRLVGKKKYTYSSAGSNHSSGVISYDINYVKPYTYPLFWWNIGDFIIEYARGCSYTSMFSSSLGTLFNPSGNTVNYGFVSETFDDTGGNGLIEHTFINVPDQHCGVLLVYLTNPMYGSPSDNSVLNNGKESMTTYYRKNGTSYQVVQRTTNYYSYSQGLYDEFVGVTANRYAPDVTTRTGAPQPDEIWVLEASDYHLYSPWNTLDSTRVDEYSPDGSIYTTMTKYGYDASVLLPNKVCQTDGYGRSNTTNNYYSGMSSIPNAASGQTDLFSIMKGQNAIGQLVYQQKASAGTPVSTHRVIFWQPTSSAVLPQEVRETNTSTSAEETLFTISQYDAYGNIRERKARDGTLHSFVWDYFGKYPVAETVGAGYHDADATSFEGVTYSGSDSWNLAAAGISGSVAYTGRKSFRLSGQGPVVRANLNSAVTYIVSFWSLSGVGIVVNSTAPTQGRTCKGWVYNEIKLTGITGVSVTGTSGYIDELRIRPQGSLITTYTYDPDIGMTSTTDVNNISTYYEYDGLKRLITMRDDQNKVLKVNKYQFYDPTKPLTN